MMMSFCLMMFWLVRHVQSDPLLQRYQNIPDTSDELLSRDSGSRRCILRRALDEKEKV